MGTLPDLLQPAFEPVVFEAPAPEPEAAAAAIPSSQEHSIWTTERFAEEQMRLLVQRLFFPGWPKAPRHVAVSAVDETTYTAEICMDVASFLSEQVPGSVCVVEANPRNPELESVFGLGNNTVQRDEMRSLRSCCQHISGRLWLAPLRVLIGESGYPSATWLERRLSDFRLEFDYSVLHAPAASSSTFASFLGHLSDGVALVLQANVTCRVAAQRAKEILQSANARVLGTVLSERTFPIPEGIYRRL